MLIESLRKTIAIDQTFATNIEYLSCSVSWDYKGRYVDMNLRQLDISLIVSSVLVCDSNSSDSTIWVVLYYKLYLLLSVLSESIPRNIEGFYTSNAQKCTYKLWRLFHYVQYNKVTQFNYAITVNCFFSLKSLLRSGFRWWCISYLPLFGFLT